MILRTEEIQEVCKNILPAVDSSEMTAVTKTLELVCIDNTLKLNVTNKTYFVEVTLPLDAHEDFRATVDALLFLKLISQITTEAVELSVTTSSLQVKANGTYKLPLIFDNDELLKLDPIIIENPTVNMDIPFEILNSIYIHNTKELAKGTASTPSQLMYYLDENGCITSTSGACVNSFSLPVPIKILLDGKIVKLFKLFKSETIGFTLGQDPYTDDIIQTKVKFTSGNVTITSILSCKDELLQGYPARNIRDVANAEFPYSVVLNKNQLIQTINRMLLFSSNSLKPYGIFTFDNHALTISEQESNNSEEIYYTNAISNLTSPYSAMLDFIDIKLTLETCNEGHVTVFFGDNGAFIIKRGNICTVIPEVEEAGV